MPSNTETLISIWTDIVTGAVPDHRQFNLWVTLFPHDIVQAAIRRTAVKAAMCHAEGNQMSLRDLTGYATHCMNRAAADRKEAQQ
jgi:hypothetical protein